MKNSTLLKMIFASLFAALTFVGTYFAVPLPFGYFNFGDCFILLCAWLVGGIYGVLGGAIGAMLADIVLGYASYAPATFVIKAVMVVVAFALFKAFSKGKKGFVYVGYAVGAVLAELIMAGGYYLFESALYGFIPALASVPGNLLQGTVAIVSAIAIISILEATGLSSKIRKG
ncbi:MAG: ECF transporter S component [Clostridia bacterium]|nr:ECF transporter S component [Clostridia bacterium]MEE1024736.1 ECF transporter S component [Acutalibacteraceae bacterium]